MKVIRDKMGGERLWFDPGEIERMMEDELRRAKMAPTRECPVVDIERFIEKYLGVHLDQYAELDRSILGLTEFFDGRPPKISINGMLTGSALDEDESAPGIRGRFRATLAHEASHVLIHRCLFEFSAKNLDLFSSDNSARVRKLHRCSKQDASYRPVPDWREFQANEGMAALLMPRAFFLRVAREEIGKACSGRSDLPEGEEWRVAGRLASVFEVSKQAATYRLRAVGLISHGQSSLREA